MKRRYQLRDNAATEGPPSHIFVATRGTFGKRDGETQRGVDELAAWHASHVRVEKGHVRSESRNTEQIGTFWDWASERIGKIRCSTWLWGYQMGRSYQRLDGFMIQEQEILKVSFGVYGATTFIVKGKLRGASIAIIDTQNWIRLTPQEIYEGMGDNRDLVSRYRLDAEADILQCIAEVNIVKYAVLQLLGWHREADLGCLRYTVSAQAMQLWRHRLGPRVPHELLSPRQLLATAKTGREYVLPLVHSSEQALRDERAAYYGPTTIAYRLGRVEGPVYQLDLQSAYPSIMGDSAYPYHLLARLERPSIDRLKELSECCDLLGIVHVKNSQHEYPLRFGRRTGRATGTYWTVLPGPEMDYALQLGHMDRCEVCYLYDTTYMFDAWKDWICSEKDRQKERKDVVLLSVVKNLGNTLHGKFGQRTALWEPVPNIVSDEPWGMEIYQAADGSRPKLRRSVAYQVQEQGDREEHPGSFPAIPAWVNSYMRLKMEKLRQIAGPLNTYYIYTDCLHTNQSGYDSLVASGNVVLGEHGKLKLEKVHNWCHYYAAGRYDCDSGLKAAGLSADSWATEDGLLHHLVYTGPDEHITHGLVNGHPVPGVLVREAEYQLRETAGGRSVDHEGWTFAPHLITEV